MKKDSKRLFSRIANFFFEVGSMRKLPRIHRQTLLTEDASDTIASHSYRTALLGWFLAKAENLDPYKVVMMCLLHDLGEARTGDHNWVHKRYIKIFEDEILADQLGTLPYQDLHDLAHEYHQRESAESVAAKDADLLDQILLLREYEWQGNKEAKIWLTGKSKEEIRKGKGMIKVTQLKTSSAKKLGEEIYTLPPSAWWEEIWTSKNR